MRRPPRARRKASPARASAEAPTERIQKVLAAAGLGSRREIERLIQEGRLKVNGETPLPGTKLGTRDRVTVDGRPVRSQPEGGQSRVILLHRSPGDPLDIKAVAARAAEQLKLTRATGRWLPIQPLPPVDGGLELLTDDGSWVFSVTRGISALTVDFMLRMRGALNDGLVAEFLAATECEGEPMSILGAEAQYGEGANHWLQVTVRATRSAQVRHWWAARGLIVGRLMRTRFGPVHLTRDLGRGRTRLMVPAERHALDNEIAAAHAPPPVAPAET